MKKRFTAYLPVLILFITAGACLGGASVYLRAQEHDSANPQLEKTDLDYIVVFYRGDGREEFIHMRNLQIRQGHIQGYHVALQQDITLYGSLKVILVLESLEDTYAKTLKNSVAPNTPVNLPNSNSAEQFQFSNPFNQKSAEGSVNTAKP